jgi:membrane-associated phospholipid phosphatase
MNKYIILFLMLMVSFKAIAEERLKFKQIFTEIPATSKKVLQKSFSKESIPYWGMILGSSALLYYYDEQIYADAQKRGRNWRIGNNDNTKPIVTISNHDLLRLPTDTGSALYFLGDGWLHAGIGAGFLASGEITKNDYTYNTGIILFHGMMTSTIFNQALKRSFGRESPQVKTHERGSWNLFPNFNEYNTRTASYDAMPSGHVMTATMTFTILSERYPEYNHIIYPLGGIWITALGFEMVNNGVHWASDYPLGIAMGYIFGKYATKIVKTEEEKKQSETAWNIIPVPLQGNLSLMAIKKF